MDATNGDRIPTPCHGCGKHILDRFLSNVNNLSWHQDCVKCNDCGITLEERCYFRSGLLYCKHDYFRRFGPECGGCHGNIMPDDVVQSVQNIVYHELCLKCTSCGVRIVTGDKIYRGENATILCEKDFSTMNGSKDGENQDHFAESMSSNSPADCTQQNISGEIGGSSLEPLISNFSEKIEVLGKRNDCEKTLRDGNDASGATRITLNSADADDENNMADSKLNMSSPVYFDGGDVGNSILSVACDDMPRRLNQGGVVSCQTSTSKKRGPRTTIKTKQLDMLKAAFIATPKPTRHIREQLAKDTGLPMRVIQVWFQNRRSKERRMKQVSMYSYRRHLYDRFPPSVIPPYPSHFSDRPIASSPSNVDALNTGARCLETVDALGYAVHDMSHEAHNQSCYGAAQNFYERSEYEMNGENEATNSDTQNLPAFDENLAFARGCVGNEFIQAQDLSGGTLTYCTENASVY